MTLHLPSGICLLPGSERPPCPSVVNAASVAAASIMKTTALIAAYSAVVASASQKDGYMYTIDQNVHSAATQYIDGDLANSIVARRRGLTDSRYLSIADASTIDDLNTFGGWQQPLFGEGKSRAPGKLFIRISGFDGTFVDLGEQLPDLLIENPMTNLRDDFKAATSRREGLCEYSVPPSVNSPQSSGVEVIFTYPQEDVRCPTQLPCPSLTMM
jgi:malate synthase